MEGELFSQEGGEVRIARIPGLRIGSQKDLTKSDSSVKVSPSGVKGSRKEEIKSNAPYSSPAVDDRGTKLAERILQLNQRKPLPTSILPPNPSSEDSTKSIGQALLIGSLLVGFFLGRYSTRIQFSIGE